jgi:hypothetical protein
MKKILLALLITTAGCITHTVEENYKMANDVVRELTVIKDSVDYLHSAIVTNLPGSEEHLVNDKKLSRYQETYIDFVSKNDSAHGKMMTRYNVLYEHYNTYKELFERVYNQLPKDSAAKNKVIRQEFEAAIK